MPVTTGIVLGGIGLASKAAGYYNAYQDEQKAKRALAEDNKTPWAKYTVSPEVSNYYSRVLSGAINPIGMTAAEKAGAKAGINQAVNTTLYNTQGASGGNLAKYISGALSNTGVNAQNQIAIQDAKMRQANQMQNLGLLGGAAGQVQNIDNMNTQAEINRKMLIQQALGQSVLQNKAYQTNTLNSIGSDLLGGGLMLGLGGGGVSTTGANPAYTAVPFARVRNMFTPQNTDVTVDPSLLATNPLYDTRKATSSLGTYFRR